jgi:hypothetical protein
MSGDELEGFFDREQLLGGSPERRAATLLFLIETRAARLAAVAGRRLELSRADVSDDERGLAFVEGFALARESTVAANVHDLERQAEGWAPLVPSNARLQAALVRRFGEKYRFTGRVAPGITKALGTSEPAVREAYVALFGEPIEAAFATRLSIWERLRWTWTRLTKRLGDLPPFWMGYALTLTETVGASVLALPIAFAGLGPLPGLVILVLVGLVNVLTVSLMAESVARSGPMRYRNAFLGRLVEGFLGRKGALGLTVLLVATSFIELPLYYVGLGETMEDVTSLPAAVWVAALFLVTLFVVGRGSLDATVGAALVVGVFNLVLLLALIAIAFGHVHGSNLLNAEVPFSGGRPFDAAAVAIVFGVTLDAYFGHTSAVLCGSLVLERDPSGRSISRGCAAATATSIVIFCTCVLAINGAIGADELTGVTGTAIGPLAEVGGTAIAILGSVYVVLTLGMGSIIESLALSQLVRERIPTLDTRVVLLPRSRAHLVFRERRNRLRAGLTFLGTAGGDARFAFDVERSGHVEREDFVLSGRRELLKHDEKGGHTLVLEVIDADQRAARVAVTTTLRTAYEGELDGPGLDLTEALGMSDVEAALTAWLVRSGPASADAAAEGVGGSAQATRVMLDRLAARGFVDEQRSPDGPLFSARLAPRRARSAAVWGSLTDGPVSVPPLAGSGLAPNGLAGPRRVVLGRRARNALALVPLVVGFAIGEWFVLTGTGSFADLTAFLGVIVVSLLAGFLPILLFMSSRGKGECAFGARQGVLRHPAVLTSIYVFFLAMLFAHGLIIWDEPIPRISALSAGVSMLVVPAVLSRSGAFGRRLTIEVCDDQRSGIARFALLSGGRPDSGTVSLSYRDDEQHADATAGQIPKFDELRRARFVVRPDHVAPPDEVKVWAYRVTPEGETESLSVTAVVRAGNRSHRADLSLSRGETVVPFEGAELEVAVVLKESDARPM